MVPFANILFPFRDYIICVDNALAADGVIYIKGSNYFLFFVVHELIFLYGFFNVLYCFTALAWISCIKERWNWIICSNWSSPKVILQVLVHTTLSYYLHVTLKKHLPLLNVGGTVDVNFCLFVFCHGSFHNTKLSLQEPQSSLLHHASQWVWCEKVLQKIVTCREWAVLAYSCIFFIIAVCLLAAFHISFHLVL